MKKARSVDCSTIFLLAPTSTKKRIALISQKSTGFIYYVSLTGVTGTREGLPVEIISSIKKIKRIAGKKPVCVGFGVSNEKQVRALTRVADGVIVGSAIVKIVEKNIGKPNTAKKVFNFVSRLSKPLKS